MAKAVRKTTAKPRHKSPAGKKTAPPKDTRESLFAEMTALLDEVDRALPTMKAISWFWPSGHLQKLNERNGQLISRMARLIAPDENDTPVGLFNARLTSLAGVPPSAARPGCFVEWIGFVPVLCVWGGFITRTSELRMVDPAEPWINDTGYQSLRLDLDRDHLDVRALFREVLEQTARHQSFKLHTVGDYGRDRATGTLAQNEWLRLALEIGPTDPIPLPASMIAIQQSFFA